MLRFLFRKHKSKFRKRINKIFSDKFNEICLNKKVNKTVFRIAKENTCIHVNKDNVFTQHNVNFYFSENMLTTNLYHYAFADKNPGLSLRSVMTSLLLLMMSQCVIYYEVMCWTLSKFRIYHMYIVYNLS